MYYNKHKKHIPFSATIMRVGKRQETVPETEHHGPISTTVLR